MANQESVGLTVYSAPADFSPFAISAGDYIGLYWTDGRLERDDLGGSGIWFLEGDYIPCASETFEVSANLEISLYATGYDEIRGWVNVGDVWKLIDTWQINIGDAWKTVSDVQINISDTWKDAWLT